MRPSPERSAHALVPCSNSHFDGAPTLVGLARCEAIPCLRNRMVLKPNEFGARVPGRCLVYRDERFPTGACDANRSRTARLSPRGGSAKGWKANVRLKEHKWAVRQEVGGEQASTREARESLAAPCRAQRPERKEQTLTRGDPGVERLREVSRGHSSDRGTHEQKGVLSEGPKERTEPTRLLDGMTQERTKRQGVTTTVTTLDWQRTGQTPKAPNPSECPGLSSPRAWEGRLPCDPIAVCGKPHVRWCGRVPGRNPRHPTRSCVKMRIAASPDKGVAGEACALHDAYER
jgi:hypothetical protein